MKAGTLLRSKSKQKLFIIIQEIEILRHVTPSYSHKIKGYRVAPCDQIDIGFAITQGELAQRFEVVT